MRRHLVIPDTQLRPGVPTDHIKWAAQAIVDYMPDVIVMLGDWANVDSFNSHTRPGSIETEGVRFKQEIDFANEQSRILVAPMEAEIARRKRRKIKQWNPERHWLDGNHEDRISRFVRDNPVFEGMFDTGVFESPGFTRHPFLKIVDIDGIYYSHYFSNTHSGRPIGGSIDNRLNKIGRSFVQGHEQGFLYGVRQFPGALTRHGLVAGSFYLHDERYRGAQGNEEWRGIVILNEVEDGSYDLMPLSMSYLRRKYG